MPYILAYGLGLILNITPTAILDQRVTQTLSTYELKTQLFGVKICHLLSILTEKHTYLNLSRIFPTCFKYANTIYSGPYMIPIHPTTQLHDTVYLYQQIANHTSVCECQSAMTLKLYPQIQAGSTSLNETRQIHPLKPAKSLGILIINLIRQKLYNTKFAKDFKGKPNQN